MVDFRYHLVSIIAVFLALATGIVVGTAALNGPIVDGLRSNINRLSEDKRSLEADVQELQTQVRAADEFADEIAPQLVSGALAGERVLLVSTPGAPGSLVDELRPLLTEAGATVTGTLQVDPSLADPGQRQLLEDLVAEVVPAGVDLPQGQPVERAAAELAAALTIGPGAQPVDEGERQAVVSAFQEAGLVTYQSDAAALLPATMVVVLAGEGSGSAPTTEQQQELETMLLVAQALDDRARGVVVAGPAGSASQGGLVAALRAQSTTADDVSSVDNADLGLGQLTVVRALVEQGRGEAGQYGAGPGASAAVPAAP